MGIVLWIIVGLYFFALGCRRLTTPRGKHGRVVLHAEPRPKFGEPGFKDQAALEVKPWRKKDKPLGTKGNPMIVKKKFW